MIVTVTEAMPSWAGVALGTRAESIGPIVIAQPPPAGDIDPPPLAAPPDPPGDDDHAYVTVDTPAGSDTGTVIVELVGRAGHVALLPP